MEATNLFAYLLSRAVLFFLGLNEKMLNMVKRVAGKMMRGL